MIIWFQVFLSNTNNLHKILFSSNNSFWIITHSFVYHSYFVPSIPTQYLSFPHRSIWPIGRILTGTTQPSESRPKSNSNEQVHHTPELELIARCSLVSYPRFLIGREYNQCMINPADRLLSNVNLFNYIYIYIYIYIVIHWQTVSLYHNSSVWLDM